MRYMINNSEYSLSYQDLREDYFKYKNMLDADFLANIPQALHFACIVSYLKEVGPEATVGDGGIVHQLVHLLTIPDEPLINLVDVRELFNKVLFLA